MWIILKMFLSIAAFIYIISTELTINELRNELVVANGAYRELAPSKRSRDATQQQVPALQGQVQNSEQRLVELQIKAVAAERSATACVEEPAYIEHNPEGVRQQELKQQESLTHSTQMLPTSMGPTAASRPEPEATGATSAQIPAEPSRAQSPWVDVPANNGSQNRDDIARSSMEMGAGTSSSSIRGGSSPARWATKQDLRAPSETPVPPIDEVRLLNRAEDLLRTGRITSARLLLEQAMYSGSARAAFQLAETYDLKILSKMQVVGIGADARKAREFYEMALAGGVHEASERLDHLP
jgi:TPR repeat protein